eukprot:m.39639 g.39639  ORF g.39639 m.39639 type:complete len:342 (+) comp9577_c0_seq1:150-1175(+)
MEGNKHAGEEEAEEELNPIPVLSDIHRDVVLTEEESGKLKEEPLSCVVSRFKYQINTDTLCSEEIATDGDGDVVVKRRRRDTATCLVSHSMATMIPDVGLQVWAGCLLLCDYVISIGDQWKNCSVLELGAGVGLLTVVAAPKCKNIICTDIGVSVLKNCVKTLELNDVRGDTARVRWLDWKAPEVLLLDDSIQKDKRDSSDSGKNKNENSDDEEDDNNNDGARPFLITHEDRTIFKEEVTIFLAADVVYVDEWTQSFADCVYKLLKSPSKQKRVLYLSIEKRINFTLSALDVESPAYDFFYSVIVTSPKFTAKQIPTKTFAQYFMGYERTPQLELWEIVAN